MATVWTAERSEVESRWGQEFSPLHDVQTGTGAYHRPRGSFLGGKPVKLTTHLPTSAEVKNTWTDTSTPPYVFMA
jgi:hypothetical protein